MMPSHSPYHGLLRQGANFAQQWHKGTVAILHGQTIIGIILQEAGPGISLRVQLLGREAAGATHITRGEVYQDCIRAPVKISNIHIL